MRELMLYKRTILSESKEFQGRGYTVKDHKFTMELFTTLLSGEQLF